MRALVIVALGALLSSGCASRNVAPVLHADEMRGFSADEARAVVHTDVTDVCSALTGQLVIEVVDAVVREWPKEPGGSLEKKKQPLLLTELRGPGTGTGTTEIVPLVAPEGYGPGESLRYFVGRRILSRPLRVLGGRVLTLRLAKNNRTAVPLWEPYAQRAGQAAAGVTSAAGGPAVPVEVLDVVFELVRRLTPDDRVLEWSTPIESLIASLTRDARKVERLRLTTTRVLGESASAELELLVYVEPEGSCP